MFLSYTQGHFKYFKKKPSLSSENIHWKNVKNIPFLKIWRKVNALICLFEFISLHSFDACIELQKLCFQSHLKQIIVVLNAGFQLKSTS